jgi:hypothetical protein
LHNPDTIIQDVINAVQHAAKERIPVALGVPFDLQKQDFAGDISRLKANFEFPKLDVVPQATMQFKKQRRYYKTPKKQLSSRGWARHRITRGN